MLELSLIQKIAVWALPILFAVTIHEAAHAYTADRFGDKTARMLGRLSLNPIKHIDPIGTIAVPLLLGVLSNFSFLFGWAKPVPITTANLKNPRRDWIFIAAAGPLSNIVMAFLWGIVLKFALMSGDEVSSLTYFMYATGKAGIIINLLLAVLNMLPLPPLDGSRIVSCLLPPKYAYYYGMIENYGLFILIALVASGLLHYIVLPPVVLLYKIILSILNV